MNNLIKIALIMGAIALGVILLFIGSDAACLGSGITACRVWRDFQWESIVAGALGLAGGIFVIASTRQQIQAQREDLAVLELKDVDALLTKITSIRMQIGHFLARFSDIADADLENVYPKAILHWNAFASDRPNNTILENISENPHFPSEIKRLIRNVRQITEHMDTFRLSNEKPSVSISGIKNIEKEWAQIEHNLSFHRDLYRQQLIRR